MPLKMYDILKDKIRETSDNNLETSLKLIAKNYLNDEKYFKDIFMMNGGCMALYNVFESFVDKKSNKI